MPYTPPSHTRSPTNSAPSSPDVSRRSSFQTGSRPTLPRSSSYLSKHRRTPSVVGAGNEVPNKLTPPSTSDDLKGMATDASVRQSPPPLTDEQGMPKGAVISPPDSAADSEEEDNTEDSCRLEKLKELQDAIKQIPVRAGNLLVSTQHEAKDGELVQSLSETTLELVNQARRRGHTRSTTEPNIGVSNSAEASLTASEEESEEDLLNKPPMVRKKSGELVRPALRPSSRGRPSSMPGTPTFSKAVHFDSHLEHVRHFLQVDRPLAVSAASSPVENYDSDTEYPFFSDECPRTQSPPYEWDIVTANHAPDTPLRSAQNVRLEKVWLSPDQKSLLGSVLVANLSFQKFVTCRFTLDYWKTTSEVGAEYSPEIRSDEIPSGHDRFSFVIKLSDLAHLESRTLYFCVRYSVAGQEFWDNNNGANFQVDFRKKDLSQNGKRGLQGAASRSAGGLPRSNRRYSSPSSPRPKSMPVGFNDFGDRSRYNFNQPIHEVLGESGPTGLRLKTKFGSDLASDNLPSNLAAPSGQAFSNRYDFGSSLSAAVQAAKDAMTKEPSPEGLYMKSHKKIGVSPDVQNIKAPPAANEPGPVHANQSAATMPGTSSPLASSSYEELVNKYCFFGSKQSSPQLREGTLKGTRFDGASDGFGTRGTNSSSSSSSRSQNSPNMPLYAGPAQHHSLRPRYTDHYHHDMVAADTSPAGNPLRSSMSSTEHPDTQLQASQIHTPPSMISTSPGPTTGGFPIAGTSPLSYTQQLQDRFPFFGNEAHATTAIRG